jgi:hypothetical protein
VQPSTTAAPQVPLKICPSPAEEAKKPGLRRPRRFPVYGSGTFVTVRTTVIDWDADPEALRLRVLYAAGKACSSARFLLTRRQTTMTRRRRNVTANCASANVTPYCASRPCVHLAPYLLT